MTTEPNAKDWLVSLTGADRNLVSQMGANPDFALLALMGARQAGDAQAVADLVEVCWPLIFGGLLAIKKGLSNEVFRRKRGRPKNGNPLAKIHARRAFRAWETVQLLGRKNLTNRQVIGFARQCEQALFPDEPEQRLFGLGVNDTLAEQSVSRGRALLDISEGWISPVCNKIKGIS